MYASAVFYTNIGFYKENVQRLQEQLLSTGRQVNTLICLQAHSIKATAKCHAHSSVQKILMNDLFFI